LTTAALAVLLVASMLAVGTTVTVAEFRTLAGRPVALVLAVLANVVVVPGIAVTATSLAGIGADATLAVALAAAAPGGGTGALLTLHARGDLATSAALQGVLAPLGLLSVPVWAAVAGHDVVPPGAGGVVLIVGALLGQLVPLGVGMRLRRWRAAAAGRVHRVSRRIADLLLAGLVLYFVVTGASRLPELGWPTVGVIAVVVLSSLAVPSVPGFGPSGVRRAVAMTTAVRNLSLALFVAGTAEPTVVLVLLAYGLLMYALSVPAALLLARTRSTV
jgi:BASS family bile acid:Na+ symporter